MKVNTSVKEFKAAASLMILDAKEAIVRALSVPWAKPDVAVALVREFRKAPEKDILLRWTIASGLSIVPNDSVFDDLVAIACDKRYSNAREMIAIALGKSSNQKAIRALIELLSDPEVQGHAVMTLVDLQANKAASRCACQRSSKICAYCRTGCLNELLLASEPDELCLISRKNRCVRLTCSYFSRINKEPIPSLATEEQRFTLRP